MPQHVIGYYGDGPFPTGNANQAAVTPTVGAAVVTTAASNTTPFGYTTGAQADAIVARINQLRVDVLALSTLITEMRNVMVANGDMKGGA